jgi:predicted dienelactone hydrolase
MLLGAAAAARDDAGLYKATAGPHRVETIGKLVVADPAAGRQVPIRVTYPSADGPFPVLVFSSFWAGTKDDFEPLIAHWVSHGYVCLRPDHADSRHFGGRRAFMPPIEIQDRPREVSFLLDRLDQIPARSPALKGMIDGSRVAAGGIYAGGATALYLGGMRIVEGPEDRLGSLRDLRVDAVLAMGPPGKGPGLTEASFATMHVPLMVITGPQDGSSRGHPAEWRTDAYRFSPPGNKYLAFIKGAGGSYGGLGGNQEMLQRNVPLLARRMGLDPDQRDLVERILDDVEASVRSVSVAFWDAHLKGDGGALEYLQSQSIEKFYRDSVELSVK